MTAGAAAAAVEAARLRLAELLPAERLDPVRPIGGGTDHGAFLLGDLVVRVPSATGDEATDPRREARLLRVVASVSPVAVPEPLATTAGWIAYRQLPGRPLLGVPFEERRRLAATVGATLGELLGALWRIPRDRVPDAAEDDFPPAEWLTEAAENAAAVAGALAAPVRAELRSFARSAPPGPPPARLFSHNDLGAEHVLVGDGRVTGVIDWADAALTDPAKDLGLILRDLGAEALAAAHARCVGALPTPDPSLYARALFYARCLALEDLAYGLETGRPEYAANATAALDRLLGAPS